MISPEQRQKMRSASHLLEDPAGEAVRSLLDEIDRLSAPRSLKGTGRTDRMLKEALLYAGKHPDHDVIIVSATHNHATALKRRLQEIASALPGRIFVEPASGINKGRGLNWEAPLDAGPINRPFGLFIDHYAIEHRLAMVLEELHRYDPK